MFSAMLKSTYHWNSLKNGLADYCHHSNDDNDNDFLFYCDYFCNIICHLGGMFNCFCFSL